MIRHRFPAALRQRLGFRRRLALVFALLGIVLTSLMAGFWFLEQEPILQTYAQSNSRALAQAQVQDIEQILGSDQSLDRRRGDLQTSLDALMLLRDQATDYPFIQGISLTLDYDSYPAPPGSLDMYRCTAQCDTCFRSDIALYHPEQHLLIGVATFCSSRQFIDDLQSDMRNRLLWVTGASLCLIALAWIGAKRLLSRLGESETNLRTVFEAAPFPMVLINEGGVALIRANPAAVDYLKLSGSEADTYSSACWDELRKAGLPTGQNEHREMEFLCSSESKRWALVSSIPVRFSGAPSRLFSLVDITELKATQRQLHLASITDALTGLYNRRYLQRSLTEHIRHITGGAGCLSVILLDIDRFKQINDTFGHAVGDAVLVGIGEIFRHCMRQDDIGGRWGGEEFLVILPRTPLAEARAVAERIRSAVKTRQWSIHGLAVTISGGVCEYQQSDDRPLIETVDRKLYQAKSQGRDRIVG